MIVTRLRRAIGVPFVLALAASACSTSGLAFTQDKRVDIVTPPNHSTQRLPVTVRWTVKDFQITGGNSEARTDAGYFAVFLDRAPQPPGKPVSYQPVSYLAKDDKRCHPQDGCPDAQWFSDHHIYPTSATTFVVDALPTFSKEERQRFHEVTVVLLDGRGFRIGESAFSVEFKVTGRAD
jgi:hypothetical protein